MMEAIALPIIPTRRINRPIRRFARPVRRLWFKIWPALLLTLALGACVSGVPNQPDFAQGTWDGQAIVPAPGLLTAYQGDLIGRRVDNTAGPTPLTISATLVDPASAQAHYAVLAGPPDISPVIVPLNAMVIAPTSIQITATHATLHTLPNFPSLGALEAQYPRTVITTPVVVQSSPPPGLGALPPVLPAPAVTGGVGPLQMARVGSVVGLPVIDGSGTPVGRVEAVAILPATGEVRYAIVSGPSFGPGYYIAVPAAQAQAGAGQVVIAGTLSQWMQAPRYRGEQLPQAIGVIGMLN